MKTEVVIRKVVLKPRSSVSTQKSKKLVRSCETTATRNRGENGKNEEDRGRARRDIDCLTY